MLAVFVPRPEKKAMRAPLIFAMPADVKTKSVLNFAARCGGAYFHHMAPTPIKCSMPLVAWKSSNPGIYPLLPADTSCEAKTPKAGDPGRSCAHARAWTTARSAVHPQSYAGGGTLAGAIRTLRCTHHSRRRRAAASFARSRRPYGARADAAIHGDVVAKVVRPSMPHLRGAAGRIGCGSHAAAAGRWRPEQPSLPPGGHAAFRFVARFRLYTCAPSDASSLRAVSAYDRGTVEYCFLARLK